MTEFLAHYGYWAIFGTLLLCGVGLPIPEELVLIPTGFLCYSMPKSIHLLPAIGVCMAGILAGDSIMFGLGRRYGSRWIEHRWVRRFLTPRMEAKVRHTFDRYGEWTVFIARFLAGARIWAYFTAGTMRMPFWKFFTLDLIGALLSVPLSIWLGKYFGEDLHRAYHMFREIIYTLVAGAAGGLVVWLLLRRKTGTLPPPPDGPRPV